MTPTNPTDDPRWDRLIHLVAGELPADEAASLLHWVEADPARQKALAEVAAMWEATAPMGQGESDASAAEAELARIRAEAGTEARVIARVGPRLLDCVAPRRARVATALKVVAAVALVVGGGMLWRLGAPVRVASPAPEAMAEYRTAPGERLSLRLPDGTRVMLAPGGMLRRPSSYGVSDRTVELEGEGYFVVTHDSTHPFAVRTAHAVARDLGTRFLVRAYADEPAAEVVVAEGSVVVGRAAAERRGARWIPAGRLSSDSLVLTPRERATVGSAGPLVRAQGVSLDRYLGWTEGRLVFERTPLTDVVHQLERWYGIEIRLAEPALGGRRLTATLREEGAAQAVDLVATSLELSVSRSAGAYVLAPARP